MPDQSSSASDNTVLRSEVIAIVDYVFYDEPVISHKLLAGFSDDSRSRVDLGWLFDKLESLADLLSKPEALERVVKLRQVWSNCCNLRSKLQEAEHIRSVFQQELERWQSQCGCVDGSLKYDSSKSDFCLICGR